MTAISTAQDIARNHQENVDRSAQPEQRNSQKFGPRINSRDGNRTLHLRLFYEWLPPSLHDAPGLDWESLPSETFGYLVSTVGSSPDGAMLAVAAAVMKSNMLRPRSLYSQLSLLRSLFRLLRDECGVTDLSQLSKREVWQTYLAKVQDSKSRTRQLITYSSLTEGSLRGYWEHLDAQERIQMQAYRLPPLPYRFLAQYGNLKNIRYSEHEGRKERADILVPLYPLLVALVQLRKKLVERLRDAFRLAQQQAITGQVTLPYPFAYEEILPVINRDAPTLSAVQLEGRPVILKFILWDTHTWIRTREGKRLETRRQGSRVYPKDSHQWFLQFLGPVEDLFWFGELVEQRLLAKLSDVNSRGTQYQDRGMLGKKLGAGAGFNTERAGLLTPSLGMNRWFNSYQRDGTLLFEPESLYRGVLYGAALATIALTTGCRVSEALQVSYDRFKTRTYSVQVNRDGCLTMETRAIYLQHLLPKGGRTEEDRQLFPMSQDAVRLLKEIYQELIAAHGAVPVVRSSPDSSKFADLKPERYLFQWGVSADGPADVIKPLAVTTLLRFLFHGLELSTAKGKPILITPHLLRHVTATAARHEYGVPLDALAWVLHHHRSERANSATSTVPESTLYYSQKSPEQNLMSIHAFHLELEQQARNMELTIPDERDLDSMNEDLQDVFERWQTLHPTAFGYCGCRFLCPRGYNRSLCIGCPYLVPDPDKSEYVQKWRQSYARQVAEFESAGNERDARQTSRIVQQLDDLMNIMRLQRQAEAEKTYRPAFKLLPMAQQGTLNV